MNWRPIETAPKDGAPILGYFPGLPRRPVQITEYREEYTIGCKGIGRRVYWIKWGWFREKPEPTHWMPLPVPPRGT